MIPRRLVLQVRRSWRGLAMYCVLGTAAAVAVVFFTMNLHLRWPWERVYRVEIAVADVKGVTPDLQEVRLAGVRVGTIDAARLGDQTPVLTLALDQDIAPLYRNARLSLRPKTALQDMYVEIESRGTPAAGRLSPGTVLPARRTAVPVDIDQILNTFDSDVRSRLKQMLDEMGSGLADGGGHLRETFASVAPFLAQARRLATVFAERRVQTRRLVHNFQRLTSAIGERDNQLAALVGSGDATFSSLASNGRALAGTIRELPPTIDGLDESLASLDRLGAELNPALDRLRPAVSALDPALRGLAQFSVRARPDLRSLRRPIRELMPLFKYLRPTTDGLAEAAKTLRPQVPSLASTLDTAERCELAVRKFFQWTSSVWKYADARGAFPRGEAVIGTDVAGGLTKDPNLKRSPSCVDGWRP